MRRVEQLDFCLKIWRYFQLYRTSNTAYCTFYTLLYLSTHMFILILCEKSDTKYWISNPSISITHWIDVLFRNGIPAQKALTNSHFMHERMIRRMVVIQLGCIAISFVHLFLTHSVSLRFKPQTQTQTQYHRMETNIEDFKFEHVDCMRIWVRIMYSLHWL